MDNMHVASSCETLQTRAYLGAVLIAADQSYTSTTGSHMPRQSYHCYSRFTTTRLRLILYEPSHTQRLSALTQAPIEGKPASYKGGWAGAAGKKG